MDLAALTSCLTSSSCLVTQGTAGLIGGFLLFHRQVFEANRMHDANDI